MFDDAEESKEPMEEEVKHEVASMKQDSGFRDVSDKLKKPNRNKTPPPNMH